MCGFIFCFLASSLLLSGFVSPALVYITSENGKREKNRDIGNGSRKMTDTHKAEKRPNSIPTKTPFHSDKNSIPFRQKLRSIRSKTPHP